MPVKTIGEEAVSHGKLLVFLGIFLAAILGLSPFKPLVCGFAGLVALTGFLLMRNLKGGIVMLFLVNLAAFAIILSAANSERWGNWIVALIIAFAGWRDAKRYLPVLRGAKSWDDLDDNEISEDEGEDRPLISIVLLQHQSRRLDSAILEEILSEAWGGSFSDESESQFVTGEDPLHVVKSDQGMWLIHNHDEPYGPPEEMADGIPELRLKTAILNHRAWMAVDLVAAADDTLPLDTYYPYIFRLIKDLANEDTLVIYRPESGNINVWNEEVADSLGSDNPLDSFSTPTNPGVIQIADDDPRMIAAVEEARKAFDVFRSHWASRTEDQSFAIKAAITRGDNTEFIWVEVTGLEPDYIHGTLGNEPVDLPGLEYGSTVEVPVSDLNDWSIFLDEDTAPLGLYTVKILQDAQAEALPEADESTPQ